MPSQAKKCLRQKSDKQFVKSYYAGINPSKLLLYIKSEWVYRFCFPGSIASKDTCLLSFSVARQNTVTHSDKIQCLESDKMGGL